MDKYPAAIKIIEVKKKTLLMSIEMLQSVWLINGAGWCICCDNKPRDEDEDKQQVVKSTPPPQKRIDLPVSVDMAQDCSNQPLDCYERVESNSV